MGFILTLELEGSQFDPVGRHKKQLQCPVYFLINHIHLALTNVIATIILPGNPAVVVLDSFLSGQNDVRGDSR